MLYLPLFRWGPEVCGTGPGGRDAPGGRPRVEETHNGGSEGVLREEGEKVPPGTTPESAHLQTQRRTCQGTEQGLFYEFVYWRTSRIF